MSRFLKIFIYFFFFWITFNFNFFLLFIATPGNNWRIHFPIIGNQPLTILNSFQKIINKWPFRLWTPAWLIPGSLLLTFKDLNYVNAAFKNGTIFLYFNIFKKCCLPERNSMGSNILKKTKKEKKILQVKFKGKQKLFLSYFFFFLSTPPLILSFNFFFFFTRPFNLKSKVDMSVQKILDEK